MKRNTRNLLLSAAVLVPFVFLALLVPPALALTGGSAWIGRAAFLLLGLIAAGIVLLYLRARARATPEPATADDEIDSAFEQARRQLAVSRRPKLGRLPVVLVLGPAGGSKTTVIVRSGLEPELLAGEVHRDDNVVPTRGLNVWLAEDTVFVEAGPALLAEPQRWARLLRHLRPSRLPALLPGGTQAPRVALLCFGCDEFLKPGSSEAVPSWAQTLRARLVDAAARLGMRLPIYVLFTKSDRLPHFADFVRSLTQEEASEVLGATLPLAPRAEAGSYAEREAARVGWAFEAMFRTMALRRLEILPRETADATRAGVYEFPREVRKLAPAATQFLVDLTRPSQLGLSPFLRGFYFTGVRAVIVGDDAWAAAPSPSTSGPVVEATAVFNPAMIMAQQQPAQPASGGRRVPEWTFLRRVLGQILLRDGVARAVTAGGTRVNVLRRTLAGSTAALLGLFLIALFVSWRNNDATLARALDASRGVERLDLAGGGAPTLEDLEQLDSLRVHLARLREWQRDGAPRSHRWGLYVGDGALESLRPLYFHRFERMLWSTARSTLQGSLEGLQPRPGETSEYGVTYDALKAYLITTDHPRESTPEFLVPALLRHWSPAHDLDPERLALVERQFAFFASELPYGNPYGHQAQDLLVARTRSFLREFRDLDRFYQALITEASRVAEPARFAGTDPVSDPVVVPGAYTAAGWTFVQTNLQSVDRLFARESWVLGDAAVPEGDRARIATDLRKLYIDDYVRHWQEYLGAARLAGFGSPQDAAAKLRALSSPQSPLLRLLAIASHNTGVDSATVGRTFQPVHAVLPPGATTQLIMDENRPYMEGLITLGAAMDQLAAAAGPAREAAAGSASGAADQIKIQVQQMAQTFYSEGGAQPVGSAIERLLMAPVRNVEGLIAAIPSADANAKGQSFCARFTPLLRKYPFDLRATVDATPDEVAGFFKPQSSVLWSFYQEIQLLVPEGTGYGPSPGATPPPTREFVVFFNRAAEISRALFSETGAGPEFRFEVRPELSQQVSEVRVQIDGQSRTFSQTDRSSRTFEWQAAAASSARITAVVNGTETTVASAQGPWAVFKVFQQADPAWETVAPGHYRVRWRLAPHNVTVSSDLRFDKRIPVFKPDYFDRLGCVSRIVGR